MARWSDIEISILKTYYPKYGSAFCHRLLPNRTTAAIKARASKLNIKCLKHGGLEKKTQEQYELELNSTDYEVLEAYQGSRVPILHRHILCGYTWKTAPDAVKRLAGCPVCSEKVVLDYPDRAKKLGYTVLEPYINSSTAILHRHDTCGYEWKTRPGGIKYLSGCPACNGVNNSKFLYLLYFSELDLYKVGITNNIKRRKYDLTRKYKIEVLKLLEFENLGDAYKAEQAILNQLGIFRVNTGELLSGNTETFIWPDSQESLLNSLEIFQKHNIKKALNAKSAEPQKI